MPGFGPTIGFPLVPQYSCTFLRSTAGFALMVWLVNYFALFVAAVVGIVVFDDDPTGVSLQEWVLFAVMLYAGWSFFRIYRRMVREQYGNLRPK